MSKYQELTTTLRNAIFSGEYPPGSRLPTIPKLCDKYEVSNTTVKRAIDELDAQGLIARRRGSGIYVKSTPSLREGMRDNSSASGQMTGFSAENAVRGKRVHSVVYDFSIVHPDEVVSKALDVSAESFVYRIQRVRVVDDVPQNIEYTCMPLEVIPGLVEKHLLGSIYGYIEGELGLKIGSAHRTIRAVIPTEDEVTKLQLTMPTALLEVQQVGYLDDGTPFEYSTTHHANNYQFFVVSTH